MDNSKLRRFAIDSRTELINIIGKREKLLNVSKKEIKNLAYELYIDTLIFKFLEVNKYNLVEYKILENIEEYKVEDIEKWSGYMKKNYNNFIEVFPSRVYDIEQKQIDLILIDVLESRFMKEINNEEIIPKDKWKEVEIIGWLYQHYISEKNDRIIKAKKRYRKDEIPIVTQLFTPKWIVEYMVQNSLGRYLIEGNPKYSVLKGKWEYYLDSSEINLEVKNNIGKEEVHVKDVKCFDPAMGSGNILVYIIEFLYDFYILEGYSKKEIPRLIIENNLYGLDIDERVYKIAYFAILMKAQEYNPDLIRNLYEKKEKPLKVNFVVIDETNELTKKDIENIVNKSLLKDDIEQFIDQFRDSKIYGSLTRVSNFDTNFYNVLKENTRGGLYEEKINRLIHQNNILNQKYDVTITNPPYIGSRYLNPKLHTLLGKYYYDFKSDIFSAFMVYCMDRTKETGQLGFMTPYVWMFISSYEKLREYIIENKSISTLIQLEYSGFSGATVPICTFTLRNNKSNIPGDYIRLSEYKGVANQPIKTKEAVLDENCPYRYISDMDRFNNIPGKPIAYWVEDRIYDIYKESKLIGDIAKPRQGIATGNNRKYLKYWYEVNHDEIGFEHSSIDEFHSSDKVYAPYNKGGKFRKWYGNFDYVIKFDKDSYEELKQAGNKLPSKKHYFKEGITWSFVSSSYLGVRYTPKGRVFDVGGSSVFPKPDMIYYLTGLMCSKLATLFVNILNPTLNFQVGDISNIPIIIDEAKKEDVEKIVKDNIRISKIDWDSSEISWNFKVHPILDKRIQRGNTNLEQRFYNWVGYTNNNFELIKEQEEELNEIFIKIYGLDGIINSTLEEEDITVTKIVEKKEDKNRLNTYIIEESQGIESFLSFFIGCTLGRYSLDEYGLIRSFGKLDKSRYKKYKPVNYFSIEKSLVERLVKFLSIGLKKADVTEDIHFIGSKLRMNKKETPEERIERYFLDEFKESHSILYRGKPIYDVENGLIRLKNKG